jgi:hypothetical protein
MNTMDNAKVIKAMEKFAMQNYLEKLASSEMRKVTLFPSLPHCGAPNLSNPVYFVMIDAPLKFTTLNSGKYLN